MAPILDEEYRISRIHELEIEREKALHQTELLFREEDARRRTLGVLQLQAENELLRDRLAQQDAHITHARYNEEILQTEADQARALGLSQLAKLKKQTTEISSLKSELETLRDTSQATQNVLQEKFVFMRELNRLRPELDQLKAKLENHQAVVSEKNDLQRLVDSLEVELEHQKREKRSIQERDQTDLLPGLRSQLKEAQKSLAFEKKEQEKLRKLHEKEVAEISSESSKTEKELVKLRKMLREAEAKWKQAQDELAMFRHDADNKRARPIVDKQHRGAEETRQSRATTAPTPDIMANIGTPGYDGFDKNRIGRKRVPETVGIGEKSTFSITPFLNRSKSIIDEPSDELSDEPSMTEEVARNAVEFSRSEPLGGRSQATLGISDIEQMSMGTLTSVKTKNPPLPKRDQSGKASTTSADVRADVGVQHNLALPAIKDTILSTNSIGMKTNTSDIAIYQPDGKKKKRKLMGGKSRNLFDTEGEEVKPTLGKTTDEFRNPKVNLIAKKGALASGGFSPLKRQRRGVGASFLA